MQSRLLHNLFSRKLIFTFAFEVFLLWTFYFAIISMPDFNLDILMYRNNNLIYCYPQACHGLPVLANLFYKVVPPMWVIGVSPFAIVLVYLLLYRFVSEDIVYWFVPLSLLPAFFYTLIPSVVDWLLLPLLYNRLESKRFKQAVSVGVVMVHFHGPYAFFYIVVLLLYLNEFNALLWISALSFPQLIVLSYLSPGYLSFFSGVRWIFPVYGWFNFVMNFLLFRMLVMFLYMSVFLILVRSRLKARGVLKAGVLAG